MSGTVVLLSGGQDSGTSLYWADQRFTGPLHAIHIYYGQRHAIEGTCAKWLAHDVDVDAYEEFNLSTLMHQLNFHHSALINGSGDIEAQSSHDDSLPASFVPGRNLFFLSIAGVYAANHDLQNIVAGMCQTDYSGYPDCRAEFINAMNVSLDLALFPKALQIFTPMMNLTKAETWKMAAELNVLQKIIEHTHTDYNGNREQRNEWGYGTLDNAASRIRAEGWEEAKSQGWVE